MTGHVRVHPAGPEHLKGIVFLERSTPGAPRWTETAYSQYLQQPDDTPQRKLLLVAESGGRVKGFAVASLVAGEVELESIAVAASARRSGVGSALLAAVRTWAAEHGGHALLLEVRCSNHAAQAFYSAHGFHRVGARPAYYQDPMEDAILLRLELK